jgi:hypothetical protein
LIIWGVGVGPQAAMRELRISIVINRLKILLSFIVLSPLKCYGCCTAAAASSDTPSCQVSFTA